MNKYIGIVLGIAILAGVGFFAFSGDRTETQDVDDVVGVVQDEVSTNEAQPLEQIAQQDPVAATSGSYESYTAEKIALAQDGTVVLFFHASWCPSCRALNSDIEANADAIPQGVTILKTDYDAETELKKKYEVTTQHTLVQVDAEGNLIKKWSGGSKLENLLEQIN